MAILYPCGVHGAHVSGKLATLYWAWNLASGERRAYRQRACVDCFREWIVPLYVNTLQETLICPVCGAATPDDLDPCYCTFYAPGQPKTRMELATCASCAAKLRVKAMLRAERLEDRPLESGGRDLSPQNDPAIQAWSAIGIQPAPGAAA